jgi:hypothetical protein
VKKRVPEYTSLGREDLAEGLWPDQDGDVVHAVRVIAAIEHPGRAGWKTLLAVGQLRPKSECPKVVYSLQCKGTQVHQQAKQ